MGTVLSSIIGYIFGAATAICAEPIRQKLFSPELELHFDDSPDCFTQTRTQSGIQARYVRVRVNNTRWVIAKECRGYLIKIEKKNDNGVFENTEYCDSIPLHWSCQRQEDKYKPIAIPKDVNQFLDVIAVHQNERHITPQVHVKPYRYEPIFNGTGIFRFSIQVISEYAKPKFIKVIFLWDGSWSNCKAYKDSESS